jgi:uncharacterized protein (TIGR02246 family)
MTDDERAIRELIETWMRATKEGDTETVVGLMTEDAVFLVAGKPPFGKEEFRKGSESHTDSGIQFEGRSEIVELNVIGDWAYAITHLSVTTVQGGKKTESRSGNTLTILKKENGKWLLARDANLLVADPK